MAVTPKTPRAVVMLAAIALLVVALSGCGAGSGNHGRAAPVRAASASRPGRPLPAGFLGLSMQYKTFERYAGTNPAKLNPAFLNLVRDIAPGQSPVLRFGGDSTDWTWWPVKGLRKPGGIKYALTPRWLKIAKAMDEQLHSRLILGVNLEAANVRLAVAEANALVAGLGRSSIAGLEIGNEPELYASYNWYRRNGVGVKGRNKATWTENAFSQQFHQFAARMPAGVPVAGPASGSAKYLASLGSFLANQPRVRLATFHAYPLKHCTPGKVITAAQLLSPAATSGFAQAQAQYVNAAHAHRKRAQLDEINGITCGGYGGVSNSFVSALWALDTLFELDRIGVDGVNFQTVPGGVQEIFGPTGRGGAMVVNPEFYGLMMFARAAPAGSRLFTIPHATVAPKVKLWATRAPDGSVRVTLINENFARPETVKLPLASPAGPASVQALRAPHIRSTSGITLGGQTFGSQTSTGILPPPKPQQLTPSRGSYTVRVPPATALLVTVPATAASTTTTSTTG